MVVVLVIIVLIALGAVGSFLVGRRYPARRNIGALLRLGASWGGRAAVGAAPVEPSPLSATVQGVSVLRGRKLEEAYKELRERPHLIKIQAIWSAAYNEFDIMAYFKEESAWLGAHPQVAIERLVVGQEEAIDELRALAKRHAKFRLFTGGMGNKLEEFFEVYLCEYGLPEAYSMSGILVLNNPLSGRPELGMYIDSPELKEYVYGLRSWFEKLRDAAVEGPRPARDPWTAKAEVYDDFICRGSDSSFLRDYIEQEDAFVEELVLSQSGDVSVLDFGSGTGRTLEHLRSKPEVRTKVALFIGFDDSRGMVREARRKRDENRTNAWERTFYFLLDGAHAGDVFWKGQVDIEPSMNDLSHMNRGGFDVSRYQESDKIITCLLNTLGVVDAATREAMLHNMFVAASANDRIAVSVFDHAAFPTSARLLYPFLKDIVTDGELRPDCYDDVSAEFRVGDYFSHWFRGEEIADLIEQAGGEVLETREVLSEGTVIGRILLAKRRPDSMAAHTVLFGSG